MTSSAERCCELASCGREFRARRFDQRFCSVWHRRAAWLASRAENDADFDSGRFAPRPAPMYAEAGLKRLREALSQP